MKKRLLLPLYFFTTLLVHAQSIPSELGPKVVFPSPQAASYGKFGGYSINHSTGSPDINIPIYTATEGDITLPLALNYFYTGAKPADEPSWVGLGMHFQPGAVITRTRKASGDELAGVQLSKVKAFVDSPTPVNSHFSELHLMQGNEYVEHQPDLFSVQGVGLSLRYVLDETGQPRILSDQKVKITYQKESYGPENTLMFTKWKIVTEDGTSYFFEAFEVSYSKETDLFHFPSAWYLTRMVSPTGNSVTFEYTAKNPLKPRTQVWIMDQHIPGEATSLTSMNHSLEIYLSRMKGSLWEVDFESSELSPQIVNGYNSYGKKLDYIRVYDTSVSPRELSRSFELKYFSPDNFKLALESVGEVGLKPYTFSYHGLRASWENGLNRRVDEYGYKNNFFNTSLIPGTPGTNLLPNLSSTREGALAVVVYPTGGRTNILYEQNDYSSVRNVLTGGIRKEVQQYSFHFLNYSGNKIHHPTSIIHITEPTTIEVSNSSGCSNPASPSAVHTLTLNPGSYSGDYFLKLPQFAPCGQVFGMCGDPSDPGCGVFAPPEGYNVYIGVQIVKNIPAKKPYYGGIRVSRMIDYSNKPNDRGLIRDFDYTLTQDTSYSSGVVAALPIYDITILPAMTSTVRVRRSGSYNPTALSNIYYSQVQEKSHKGEIQYSYTAHSDKNDLDGKWAFLVDNERGYGIRAYNATPNVSIGEFQTYEIFRGLPKQVKVLNKQGKTMLLTDIVYSGFNTETFKVASLYFERIGSYFSFYSSGGALVTANNDLFYGKGFYITGGWPRKSKETVTRYDSTGANPVVSTTDFYYENPLHLQLTKTRTTLSDDSIEEETIKYPLDYATVPGKAPYLQTMIDSNLVNYPLETVKVREYNPADRRTIQATATTYRNFDGNTAKNLLTLPYKYFTYNGVGTFIPYSGLSSETASSAYFEKAGALNYSSRGNLLYSYRNAGSDSKTTYLWGYKGQYPIAEIRNSDHLQLTAALGSAGTTAQSLEESTDTAFIRDKLNQLRNALPASLIKTSLYKPNFGLIENQGTDLISTKYEYDTHARLAHIRNQQDSLISSYSYYQVLTGLYLDLNYIRTAEYRTGTLSEDLEKARVTYRFLDRLGRDSQTLMYRQSPLKKNIFTETIDYDSLGRPSKVTLPVSDGSDNPSYTFSTDYFAGIYYNDNKPYSSFIYDALDRNVRTYNPGQAWGDRSVKTAFETADDDVRLYKISSTEITLNGNYPSGTTYLTRTTDEQENVHLEISDKKGNVLEKRGQVESDNVTTAYVYDDAGRVKAVIQPEGYALNTGIAYDSDNFKRYVFFYEYDEHSRIIRKHIPGAGWTEIVYDRADRPVLEQDARQKTLDKWSFTRYDVFARIAFTGEITYTGNRATLQAAFDAHEKPYETWLGGGGWSGDSYPAAAGSEGSQVQQFNFYDQYDFVPGLNPAMAFESAGAYHPMHTSPKGKPTGTVSYNSDNSGQYFMSTLYYDDLGRLIQQKQTHLKSPNTPNRTDFQYNFAGEVIQQKTTHKTTDQTDVTTLARHVYDHAGRPTQVFYSLDGAAEQEIINYSYDEIGRLRQKKYLPNGSYSQGNPDYIYRPPSPGNNTEDWARKAIILQPGTLIDSSYTYLAAIDTLEGGTPFSGLQTMDYAWHIRGGLRGINLNASGNAVPDPTQGDLFAYKLDYENAGQWSGNIGRQSWNHVDGANPVGVREYAFTYDPLDRLKSATFGSQSEPVEDYSLSGINYDKNGNILNLQRNGKVNSNTYGAIDNLSYSYLGNRLTAVSDAVSGNHEVDFVKRGSGAYTYWENGALKSDENKEIINITYNTYLNKPDEIQLTDGRWIKMTYDGSGALIKREFSTGEYWEYTNGIIFKNGNFYSLGIPDGRAIFEGGNWNYEFFYQDHLGNTRVSFAAGGNTLVKKDATDFEPFGTRLNGTGTTNSFENRHLYQNKETLQLFGLENINDFGARYVDRSIGRFLDIDLMATEFSSWSPYHYLHNSPVNLVDPTGMFAEDPDVPGGKTKNDPIAQGFMNFGSKVWSFGKALVNNPRETLGNMASGAAQSLGNFARQDGGNLANASRRVAGEAYSGYVARLAASGDPAYESQVVLGELAAEATVGALLTRGATSLASRGAVETIADVGASAAKASTQFTKSNLKLGQEMHRAYHAGKVGKEFRLPSGKRIDFLDINNRTIYELKPFNPRAMQQGQKQLNIYMQELQTMPRFKGIQWKTVLDTY